MPAVWPPTDKVTLVISEDGNPSVPSLYQMICLSPSFDRVGKKKQSQLLMLSDDGSLSFIKNDHINECQVEHKCR